MSRKSSINKIKKINIAAKDIEATLVMDLYLKGHSPISTHAAISSMQECDVISISKSDYIYEYEVKISRGDFKRDFKKYKHTYIKENQFTIEYLTRKGKIISHTLPNYFYFVMPTNLVSIEEIPEYAGLIYIDENMKLTTIKKAPLIHKIKATNELIRNLSHQLTCKLVFKKVN